MKKETTYNMNSAKNGKKIIDKNQNAGITLIALVVMIIVILIISTVSINVIFAEGGILDQAQGVHDRQSQVIQGREEDMNRLLDEYQNEMNRIPQQYRININKISLIPNLTDMNITINVFARNTEGATFEYYYKEAGNDSLPWIKVHEGEETSYIITGTETGAEALVENQQYVVKVVGTKDQETSSVEKNVRLISMPSAEDAIEFNNLTWNNGEASVSVEKTTMVNYTIKYRVENKLREEIVSETIIESEETISNLKLGDVLYVWLTDSEGTEGEYKSLTITDIVNPETPNIGAFNKTAVTPGEEVKVTVKLEDKQSGIDCANSRWIISPVSTNIGTELSTYQETAANLNKTYGTFGGAVVITNGGTKVEKEITIKIPNDIIINTTYHLHILSTDKAGRKIETISEGTINVTAQQDYEVLAYLNFDESGDDFLKDSVSESNFTLLGGSVTRSTSTKKEGTGSAYFSGTTSQRINKNISSLNLGTDDFTICFWAMPEQQTYDYPVFCSDEGNSTFQFFVADSILSSNIGVTLGGSRLIDTRKKYTTGEWTHYAIVRKNGVFYIYENGICIGSDSSKTTYALNLSNLSIGGNSATSATAYKGYMDEFIIYRGALWSSNFTPPASTLH